MDTVVCERIRTSAGEDMLIPSDWLFTNMDGVIESKKIEQLKVNDVIKAFLVNLNPLK